MPGTSCAHVHIGPLRAWRRIDDVADLRRVKRPLVLLLVLAPIAGKAQDTGPVTDRYEIARQKALDHSGGDEPALAIAHAQQALLIARELRDTTRILGSLYLLTKFNVEARHYDEADRLRREHLALAERYGKDVRQLALAHNSMGSMYSRAQRTDPAEQHFRAALHFAEHTESRLRRAILGNLASTLAEQGDHQEAVRLHRLALDEAGDVGTRDRAWMTANLARSLMHAQRHQEALAVLHTADSLDRIGGSELDLSIDLAELRAEALAALGDHEAAYDMALLALYKHDTLFEKALDEQYLELEKIFETRAKEEEIQRLGARSRAQQERLRLRNIQLYGSMAVAVLLLGGVLLVFRNLRLKRRHATALEGLNAELKDQKERIEEINGLLRLKVLRTQMDPHFIHNCLSAIKALSMEGAHEQAENYLDGFARLLRMVLEHSVRDRIGLDEEIEFLHHYITLEELRMGPGFTWAIEVDEVLAADDVTIPSLLIQPFVENAIWHGLAPRQGARRLDVRFVQHQGTVVCTVQDNGVGRQARSPTPGRRSLGLQLTGERLELLARHLADTDRLRFTDLQQDGTAAGTRVEIRLT
jgi:two-component sensor histidine kinase